MHFLKYRQLFTFILVSSALLMSFFVYPLVFGNNTTCFWQGTIGWPCPGCGMTRSLFALGSGQLHLAWQMHPMIFIAPPLLFLYCYHRYRKNTTKANIILIAFILLFFLIWIIRIIFMFPNQEPMIRNEHPLFHLFHYFL